MASPETSKDKESIRTDPISRRILAMAEDLDAILDLSRRNNLGDVTAVTTGQGVPSFTTDRGLAYINDAAEAEIEARSKRRGRQLKRQSKI